MRHGWNSTAYQILNPGIRHWFGPDGSAVVGYVRRHNYLLVAGAPVCANEDLEHTVNTFEAFADRQRCRVCYVCASGRLHELLGRTDGHASIAAGSEPAWEPRRSGDYSSASLPARAGS